MWPKTCERSFTLAAACVRTSTPSDQGVNSPEGPTVCCAPSHHHRYHGRWTHRTHALCTDAQRQAVLTVLMIARRARAGPTGTGRAVWEGMPVWSRQPGMADVWLIVLDQMGIW